jgi:putative membrane protein
VKATRIKNSDVEPFGAALRATRQHEHGHGRDTLPALCLGIFVAVWLALAISPRHRKDWFLENLLTLVFVPALVATYRKFRFSDRAYVQGLVFLTLHTIGSHYTYSEVPLGEWLREATGGSRNHYDRIVHFAFGVLAFRPLLELTFRSPTRMGRAGKYFLVAAQIGFVSVLYEMAEWLTVLVVDKDAGAAFLGAQGDEWDAQKDMALACGGAFLAALAEACTSRLTQRRARSA